MNFHGRLKWVGSMGVVFLVGAFFSASVRTQTIVLGIGYATAVAVLVNVASNLARCAERPFENWTTAIALASLAGAAWERFYESTGVFIFSQILAVLLAFAINWLTDRFAAWWHYLRGRTSTPVPPPSHKPDVQWGALSFVCCLIAGCQFGSIKAALEVKAIDRLVVAEERDAAVKEALAKVPRRPPPVPAPPIPTPPPVVVATPPRREQAAAPPTVQEAAPIIYSGNVGSKSTAFELTWHRDGRVTGLYIYHGEPTRPKYSFRGRKDGEGQLILNEYSDGDFSARIILSRRVTRTEVIWEGTMFNADGRKIPTTIRRPRLA
ncbi:MAG: hypothetical protein JSR82_03045 [Verrucomicrobia bacterium]|nr:hypothetical protein [Verrucomicrobiota bacterium]